MRLALDLGNFDACPAYNDWLDEQHGSIDIFGYQPRASEVLFSLSQDTYQATFDDFQRQWEEGLKETVFHDFPSPIAHYFYRFENGYENDLQRLHLLRDSWEALVDVLHSLAVAECRFRRIVLPDTLKFKDFLTDSVAQRLLNIERIIAFAQDQSIQLAIANIVSIPAIANMRELNQSRNGFSHSAAQSETQARTWISELYEDVINVLDDLRGLKSVQVLRHVGQHDARTLRCEVFRGHAFTKTIENVSLHDDQVCDSQKYFIHGHVLAVVGEIVVSMRPFLHYQIDASGHTTKLTVFRRAYGDEPMRRFEYAVTGEGASCEEDRLMFKSELDEFRALVGIGPE
jgi:hypothetical protein